MGVRDKENGWREHTIGNLTAALNERFETAVEQFTWAAKDEKRAVEELEPRVEKRLDKQGATHRMIRTLCGGG